MSDTYTDRLSDYLDDELSAAERRDVEAHIAGCEECAAVLRDLDRIRTLAASLPAREPTAELWGGIAAAIERESSTGRVLQEEAARSASPQAAVVELRPTRPTRDAGGNGWHRRIALTLPQLAAAAVLLLVGGSAVGVWLRAGAEPVTVTPQAGMSAAPAGGTGPARFAALPSDESTEDLDRAITDLEGALVRRRGQVDPATLEVIDQNLAVIDSAIAQIRRALRSEPSSPYLNHSLTEAMWRKLDVLRVATRAAGVSG